MEVCLKLQPHTMANATHWESIAQSWKLPKLLMRPMSSRFISHALHTFSLTLVDVQIAHSILDQFYAASNALHKTAVCAQARRHLLDEGTLCTLAHRYIDCRAMQR